MRVSREARVLLALVAIAAAAWVWINYFSQNENVLTSPAVSGTATESAPAAPRGDALNSEALNSDGSNSDSSNSDSLSTGDVTGSAADSGGTISPFGTVPTPGDESASVDTENPATAGASPALGDAAATDAATPQTASAVPPTIRSAPDGVLADGVAIDGVAIDGVAINSVAVDGLTGSVVSASSAGDGISADDTATTAASRPKSSTTGGSAAASSVNESGRSEGRDAAPSVALAQDEPLQPLQGDNTSGDNTLTDSSSGSGAGPLAAVAQAGPLTAREVEVAELPFLVTEPPAPDTLEDVVAPVSPARPDGGVRATVNPFSPILLAPPPDEAQNPVLTEAPAGSAAFGLAPPSTPSGIIDVPIPNAPVDASAGTPSAAPQVPTRITAPAPQLLTPKGDLTASLPRPLPGGTLPATPDLLRTTTRTAPEPVAAVAPLTAAPLAEATVAALRVPSGAASPTFAEAAPPTLQRPEALETELLPLAGIGRGPANSNPIAAGTSSLTRYLRDSNYRFTGYVISAVGVGVFRSNEGAAPVVVTLGQSIPGTDIVLTSLKGEQAELTLNDEKQILILNPGG